MSEYSQNPYAPPLGEATAIVQPAEDLPLASRKDRFWAALIDLGIEILIVIIVMIWIAILKKHWDPFRSLIGKIWFKRAFQDVSLIIGFFLINGMFLAETGQTVGKKILKIKIVTLDGRRPRIGPLIFRRYLLIDLLGYACAFIPVVGIYMTSASVLLIFRKNRRCFHDYTAGTKVVSIQPEPPSGRPSPMVVHLRHPELILGSPITDKLHIDPKTFPLTASFGTEASTEFLNGVCREFPLKDPSKIRRTTTYGELLDFLEIPAERMRRLPGKITYRKACP